MILRTRKRIKIVDMFKKSIITVYEQEIAEKDGASLKLKGELKYENKQWILYINE